MRTQLIALVVVTVIIGVGSFYDTGDVPTDSADDGQTATTTASVRRVIDGDTIQVRITDDKFMKMAPTSTSVRLIGIDAPEIDWANNTAECFAREARSYLHKQLSGKRVVLKTDLLQPHQDDYGRVLAYVITAGVNINKRLITKGYAKEMTVDPGYAQQDSFLSAQKSAQTHDRGLWSHCQPGRENL